MSCNIIIFFLKQSECVMVDATKSWSLILLSSPTVIFSFLSPMKAACMHLIQSITGTTCWLKIDRKLIGNWNGTYSWIMSESVVLQLEGGIWGVMRPHAQSSRASQDACYSYCQLLTHRLATSNHLVLCLPVLVGSYMLLDLLRPFPPPFFLKLNFSRNLRQH